MACVLAVVTFPSAAGAQSAVLLAPGGGGVHGTFGGRVADGGARVLFQSASATLVPGDSNGATDLFLWRRGAGTLTRVSVGPHGEDADAHARRRGRQRRADGQP